MFKTTIQSWQSFFNQQEEIFALKTAFFSAIVRPQARRVK
jgi:hypothetical protein